MENGKLFGIIGIILIIIVAVIGYFSFSSKNTEKIISELCEDYKNFKVNVSCEEALSLIFSKYPDTKIKEIDPLPQLPNDSRVWKIILSNNKEIIITKDKKIIEK